MGVRKTAAGRTGGFTLIELLVVVAVIAILATLVIPSTTTVLRRARRTADLSNLRSFSTACLLYAGDEKGLLPMGDRYRNPDRPNRSDEDDMAWFNWDSWVTLRDGYGVEKEWASCLTYRNTSFYRDSVGEPYYDATFLGWIYLPRRHVDLPNSHRGFPITKPRGRTREYYKPMNSLHDESTTRMMVSCRAYTSPHSWGGWLPHGTLAEDGIWVPPTSRPFSMTGWDGFNASFADGSARWVARDRMHAFHDDGIDFIYYEPKNDE